MQNKIPIKPRLKRSFVVKTAAPDTVFLLSENRSLVFNGKAFIHIVPLLDGNHTVPDILGKTGKIVSVQEFFITISQLAQKGCLTEADGRPSLEHAAFWDHLNADSTAVVDGLKTSVSVTTVGDVESEVLIESLESNGIQVQDKSDMLVVAAEDYLMPELEEINQKNFEIGRPWLLIKPTGMVVWIGPLIRPGNSACWKCLEQRLKANRQVERYIKTFSEEPLTLKPSRAKLKASVAASMNLASIEIAKTLVLGNDTGLENKVITFDMISLEYKEHTLVKRPQCQVCGSMKTLEPQPITLQSRIKVHPDVSGHRAAMPEETFNKYEHHISPITGTVTSIHPREDESEGLVNNYTAGHYFPIFTDDVKQLQINLYARSGAGGQDANQAKTGTLCESLERYSGIYWGDEKKIMASYSELGSDAIHLDDLALYSDEQYRNRKQLNKKRLSDQQFIPDPPDDDAKIAWSPSWSLTDECFKYLPTSYCYYGYQDPGIHSLSDSNGNAAGNNLEEAILQGFLELVERDAVALWWYNRISLPAVDVDSFNIPYWEETRTCYQNKLNRDIHVLDLTSDLNIPTFAVVSRRLECDVEDIILGFSAHMDPATALHRAIAGTNQYLPAIVNNTEDGTTKYRNIGSETIAWWKRATYENQPYLIPDPEVSPKTVEDFTSMASDDIMTDLKLALSIAREKGLDVLVVDQTRPDIGLSVVKVVVPRLRHFWRRLAPGRLYDVPVELGWVEEPRKESEMNSIACFV